MVAEAFVVLLLLLCTAGARATADHVGVRRFSAQDDIERDVLLHWCDPIGLHGLACRALRNKVEAALASVFQGSHPSLNGFGWAHVEIEATWPAVVSFELLHPGLGPVPIPPRAYQVRTSASKNSDAASFADALASECASDPTRALEVWRVPGACHERFVRAFEAAVVDRTQVVRAELVALVPVFLASPDGGGIPLRVTLREDEDIEGVIHEFQTRTGLSDAGEAVRPLAQKGRAIHRTYLAEQASAEPMPEPRVLRRDGNLDSGGSSRARLSVVIPACSIDDGVLQETLESLTPLAHRIVVVVKDHFNDGRPENRTWIAEVATAFPTVEFLVLPFSHGASRTVGPDGMGAFTSTNGLWTARARWVGARHILGVAMGAVQDCSTARLLSEGADEDWVLFLDADEIADTEKLRRVLEAHTASFDAGILRARQYNHGRLDSFEDNHGFGLLVRPWVLLRVGSDFHLSYLERSLIQQTNRHFLLPSCEPPVHVNLDVTAEDGGVLIHHKTSIRRSAEKLRRKYETFSHNLERQWTEVMGTEAQEVMEGPRDE